MREINRILCPVDLSDVSRDTIAHAVLLASWYKAKITALHVRNPLVVPETDFRVLGFGPPLVLTDDEVNDARAQVLACFGSAGVDVDVLIESGRPAQQILERATSLPGVSHQRTTDSNGTSGPFVLTFLELWHTAAHRQARQ